MDKWEIRCNAELCPHYFSVNVSVLAVVFRQQIYKNQQFCLKFSGFLKLLVKNTRASTEMFTEN